MNRKGIYSDGTGNFVSPSQPGPCETVELRCRVATQDVDAAYVVINGLSYKMQQKYSTSRFDFYAYSFVISAEKTTYYFELHKADEILFFNRQGVVEQINPYFNFCLIPGFSTPEWAKGAVMYQIFVDRFCNGDSNNDVEDDEYTYIGEHVRHIADWNQLPAAMDVRHFYGGDLKGVLDNLDYLQELGVEVLYLNPIFVSPSNHKYDTQDYDHIDPHYGIIVEDGGECLAEDDLENAHAGKYIQRVVNKVNLEASNDFFAKFMKEVHARGMKVILDGVFNHCGSFNKWMDREKIYAQDASYEKGAFVSENSPYSDFFHFYPDGSWPDNTHYDSWWGNDTLPKLNYEDSQQLEDYIMRIAAKWVSEPYCIDGWRLDVAADLGHSRPYNHHFWKRFRDTVKAANSEAVILAEHYGDPSPWLDGTQWDTVMNYDAFMEPISWFLTGMEKHSDVSKPERLGDANHFFTAMTNYRARFTTPSLQVAMNELSNHDHSRFLTRTNHHVGRTASAGARAAEMGVDHAVMRLAVMMQMTWDGAPTIYYGDEAGLCGWTDPDNRRCYPWGKEDKQMIAFHREMIRLHRDYPVFRMGSLIELVSEPGLVGYGRFTEKEKAFVLVQVAGEPRDVIVEVWRLGIEDGEDMVQMIATTNDGFAPEAILGHVTDGTLTIHMEPGMGVVWKNLNLHGV